MGQYRFSGTDARAIVNCWDEFVFNTDVASADYCTWVNAGTQPEKPTITANGPTIFNEGGSVTLTSSEGVKYIWSTGETTKSIVVGTSGEYWVKITDAKGCESEQSLPTIVTVIPNLYCGGSTLGNTEVYTKVSTSANRRGIPVTFTEAGEIRCITIYHNGGTGNVLLGVYSDASGSPTSLLGVTPSTPINSGEGWQTISLTNHVSAKLGQTVWLSWVFEKNPGIRYIDGTPAKAQSLGTWSQGMPETFGSCTFVNKKYSIYCSYEPEIEQPYFNMGITEIFRGITTASNRRAVPVTFTEDGKILSISIYHNGGLDNMLLGVYSDNSGSPSTMLGKTASTVVSSVEGWQTVPLMTPIDVTTGETIWLSWVFQNNPGVRYAIGKPARAQSPDSWTGDMPTLFGASTFANYRYSIYCTYTKVSLPELTVSPTSIMLDHESGAKGTFEIMSNTSWSITDDASWINLSSVSGMNNEIITVTANSANTGTSPRTATVTITGTGVTNRTVTVTQNVQLTTAGTTDIYGSTSTADNRRAIPVTFTEDGLINSIAIYHNGGNGNLYLGVYSTQSGSPSTRLGVTASTPISNSSGWQTVTLTNPVPVTSGQTVWLAWVFQNNPGIRYKVGSPARAQSPLGWAGSGSMPFSFGSATFTNYTYSIYCNYTPVVSPPMLTVAPEIITLGSESGSIGTFSITSNISWSITDDASWLTLSSASGSNNGTITITANSANTGTSPRTATVTITGTGVTDKTVTVTQNVQLTTAGTTDIYGSTSTADNRRAIPVTFTEDGLINSIAIYHNGGNGNLYLGVYSTQSGSPSTRLGVTASTPISNSSGWQTVTLTNPVSVTSGQTVWLAWVFQNNPGVRYKVGSPARAQSPQGWAGSGSMPSSFGSATFTNYTYSIYCNYTPLVSPSMLSVAPENLSLGSASGSNGTFSITSNTTWSVNDDAGWLNLSSASGSNNGTITVKANSANTGTSPRTATVTITGTGVTDKTVTVTQDYQPATAGTTEVFGMSTTSSNRRAVPVTFTESGTITSISIYHNGGTGNVYLGVYSTQSGGPSQRLGVTVLTPVNAGSGWQTVTLTNPVSVTTGQTIWLAWVFQNNPGIRFTVGSPARAQSPQSWTGSGSMPVTFGSVSYSNYRYSIYCNYIRNAPLVALEAPKSAEVITTDIISSHLPIADLKVYPNPFSEKLRFEFVSPESVNARIDLYDMTGRMVKTIFEAPVEGGISYEAEFRPETIISGMYVYRVTLGEAIYNGKVVFKKY